MNWLFVDAVVAERRIDHVGGAGGGEARPHVVIDEATAEADGVVAPEAGNVAVEATYRVEVGTAEHGEGLDDPAREAQGPMTRCTPVGRFGRYWCVPSTATPLMRR